MAGNRNSDWRSALTQMVGTRADGDRWIQGVDEGVRAARAKDPQHFQPTYVGEGKDRKSVLYVGNAEAIAYEVTRPHPHEGYPSLATAMALINFFVNRIGRYLDEKDRRRYAKARKILEGLYKDQENARTGEALIDKRRRALRKKIAKATLAAIDEQQEQRESARPPRRRAVGFRPSGEGADGEGADASDEFEWQPEEEDIFIDAAQRTAYYLHRPIAEVNPSQVDVPLEALCVEIRKWMDAKGYWPNVWVENERGGHTLLSIADCEFTDHFHPGAVGGAAVGGSPWDRDWAPRGSIRDRIADRLSGQVTTGNRATALARTGAGEMAVAAPNLRVDVIIHDLGDGSFMARYRGRPLHLAPGPWPMVFGVAQKAAYDQGVATKVWVRSPNGIAEEIDLMQGNVPMRGRPRRALVAGSRPLSDWQAEVANGDTRLGYSEWIGAAEGPDHPDAFRLIEQFGVWGEHPAYPVEDWQYQVRNGDTRRGYWAWVASEIERSRLGDV